MYYKYSIYNALTNPKSAKSKKTLFRSCFNKFLFVSSCAFVSFQRKLTAIGILLKFMWWSNLMKIPINTSSMNEFSKSKGMRSEDNALASLRI